MIGCAPATARSSRSAPLPTCPAKPDDLARPNLETDRFDKTVGLEILDHEHRLAERGGFGREHRLERSPEDALDEGIHGQLRDRHGRLADSVPEDGDSICDLEDLAEPVRDVDDPVPFVRQGTYDLHDALDLDVQEGRGWLVQNQDPCVAGQQASDLDALSPGDGERLDQRRGVEIA